MDTQRPLTTRQQEVLKLWLEDVPYKELAAALGISPETVNPHLKAIRKKLGATGISRAALRDASSRAGTGTSFHPPSEISRSQPSDAVSGSLAS